MFWTCHLLPSSDTPLFSYWEGEWIILAVNFCMLLTVLKLQRKGNRLFHSSFSLNAKWGKDPGWRKQVDSSCWSYSMAKIIPATFFQTSSSCTAFPFYFKRDEGVRSHAVLQMRAYYWFGGSAFCFIFNSCFEDSQHFTCFDCCWSIELTFSLQHSIIIPRSLPPWQQSAE